MKIGGQTISWLELAVAAVGTIAAIMYYRQQAAASAAAQNSPTGGAFPYFQTAALPTSNSAGGAAGAGVVAPATDTTAVDLASLLKDITAATTNQQINAANVTASSTDLATIAARDVQLATVAANVNTTNTGVIASNQNAFAQGAFSVLGEITKKLPFFDSPLNAQGTQTNSLNVAVNDAGVLGGSQSVSVVGSVQSQFQPNAVIPTFTPPPSVTISGNAVGLGTPLNTGTAANDFLAQFAQSSGSGGPQ